MNGTIENMNGNINGEEFEVKKPYEFRALSANDVFPMFTILNKIGIREFKNIFANVDDLKKMIAYATKPEDENTPKDVNDILGAGLSLAFDVAGVILNNLPRCENEIFKLLAQTSNLDEKDIRKIDFTMFFEMIIDFIKKEEFKDFIKAVSKLFK